MSRAARRNPEPTESAAWRALAKEVRDPVKFSKVFLKRQPTRGQAQILRDPAQNVTVVAGRRFGKSVEEAIASIFMACIEGGSIQYIIAPNYDQVSIIFNEILTLLDGSILKPLVEEIKRSPYPLIRFANGSVVHGRSTTHANTLRGKKAHRLRIDEAGFIPDETISQVLEPMLADYDGGWNKVGTPFGKNHFYDTFNLGRDEMKRKRRPYEHSAYHFTSLDNPHISRRYILRKRRLLGPDSWIFRTEYLGEFLDALNAVFGWDEILQNVRAINLVERGLPYHRYAIGVDLARTLDYTVIAGLDITNRPYTLVWFERFNRKPWAYVIERIQAASRALNGARPLVDQTGVGDPVVEMLASIGAKGIRFNNENKTDMITRLQRAVQGGEILYPNIPPLLQEMKFFEMEPMGSGKLRLQARAGYHDDTVIALALAHLDADKGTLPSPAEWDFTGMATV